MTGLLGWWMLPAAVTLFLVVRIAWLYRRERAGADIVEATVWLFAVNEALTFVILAWFLWALGVILFG